MRRGCLLLLLPVGLLLGLAWVTMPTLTQVVSTYVPVQTIAKIVSNPSLPDKPPAALEKDKPTDAALAPYQPNLRSPFAADLAQQANAPRYEIELSFDADTHKITGQQTVRYVNQTTKPLSDLVLRLYPNTQYMGGKMTLAQVRLNEIKVLWAWSLPDQSAMRVLLPRSLQPSDALTLSLNFTIDVPADPGKAGYLTFGEFDGLWALPNAYAMIALRDADGWRVDPAPNFGDIVFSEMALYRVRINAPSRYKIVATGSCTADGLNPFAITTCVAGPVRDFAIHLSESYEVASTTVSSILGEPIRLTSYFLPQHRTAGQHALDIAANAIGSYEKRFGAYPYAELKLFATTTIAGGIEYPNLAGVLYKFYERDDDYFEWLVAHEVAHQWWYNLVGSNPITEPWLDEALTQYSASLYMEDRYGMEAAQKYRTRYFTDRFATELKEKGDRRVGQPTSAFPRWSYFPIVYGKGPLFFDAVRKGSDDARFGAWLRKYYERFRYSTARANDLLQAAEDAGLGPVVRVAYDEWILGKK